MKNCRRFMTHVSFVLCAALAFSSVTSAAAAESGSCYEEYRSGEAGAERTVDESKYTVISVSTEEELAELAANCGLDSWSRDKYIKLTGDIALSEHCDLMFPTFGGIFDGCGYTISNLQTEASGSALGLFRYIRQGAVVKNLTVTGRVYPEGSRSSVGILAGVNYGRIVNCSVSGSIAGDEAVGGLVGVNEASGEIRACSSGAMVAGDHSVGGICGVNYGTLNNCSNSGKINTYSAEVTYDLEDITMESLEQLNSMNNVAAHTDTGGIAGYSEGKIYYCTNTGAVGYQHVGYNTGGIVGRLHQGYVQNCTNSGEILGRKDVGGIAGQMEPFLEIQYLNDKLQEIDRETEELLNLLDAAQQDLSRYGKQASSLNKALTASLKNASNAASYLSQTGNDLWYIYNQELTGIGNDLQRLNTDLENQGSADKDNGHNKDNTVSSGNVIEGAYSVIEGTDNIIDGANNVIEGVDNVIDGINREDITVSVPDDIDMESYAAALRRFGESTSTHITNMTRASSDRSGGITENLNTLNRELEAAGDYLQQLSDVLEQGADNVGEDMDAVTAQMRVLRKSISELRDDLFRYEGISVEDASDEAANDEPGNPGAGQEEALYDTSSFQQGKITLCLNRGKVEADTNVGGIVGMIATEYDFDPEDDITLTGEESFHIEQTVKAVVRESCNFGEIVSKKDYVGGVVGKADFGAVISCESYGDISSTGGSYVGGIAGASGYAVRSCYFLGSLSGKNYVGGIVGKGCDIFYSCAYPSVEMTGECGGSIAGQISEDGRLWGNYYVKGGLPGVDSVGYEGGAEPVEYEELCSIEGIPDAFAEFTVTFTADGKALASFTCKYGDALDESLIPEVPEKKGYYGSWPETDYSFIRGNLVLEAEYRPWISSVAGGEKDENGRSLVMVQGSFRPGAELLRTEEDGTYRLEIVYRDEAGNVTEEYTEPVQVRVLCEDTEHTVVEWYDGSAWLQAETSVMGSYLEFSMEKPGIYRVTISEDSSKMKIAVIAAGACAVLVLSLAIVKLTKRRRKKRARRKEEGQNRADSSGAVR